MSLGSPIPQKVHDKFGAWMRIEPVSRSDNLRNGIEVRTADALWMLARQWQTSELKGEDAGSPVLADLDYSTREFPRLQSADDDSANAPSNTPLETQVEREPWRESWRDESQKKDWRWRVRIGQQCERLIYDILSDDAVARERVQSFRSDYPLSLPNDQSTATIDPKTRRFLQVVAGRAIDGIRFHHALREGSVTGLTSQDTVTLKDKIDNWLSKVGFDTNSNVAEAWRNRQLDYRFKLYPPQLNSDEETDQREQAELIAPNYRSGKLDWYTFDALDTPDGSASEASDSVNTNWASESLAVAPTRISVGGTSPRWWAFEDAATNFGALDVARTDPAKLMIMEFALIYGDDWFSIPLTARMPSMVRVDNLKVVNVFGEHLNVSSVRSKVRESMEDAGADPHDPLTRWELFSLSPHESPTTGGPGDTLIIPPVVADVEESKPYEEVHFLRDEGANRVWGVEHTILDGTGRPVRGFDAQLERLQRRVAVLKQTINNCDEQLQQNTLSEEERSELEAQRDDAQYELDWLQPPQPAPDAAHRFLLATRVPENWIPFNPVRSDVLNDVSAPGIRLRRARMPRRLEDGDLEDIPAQTRILSLDSVDPLYWLDEETVTRAGLRLQLTAQRARWTDGTTHVWVGRKVRTGSGEGASGLRHDILK